MPVLLRVALLALLAAALAAPLAAPAPAPAAEIGLNVQGGAAGGTDAAFAQLRSTRAKWSRHFVYWPSVEGAGRGRFDPGVLAAYDAIADRAVRQGIKPIFVVTGSPAWASGSASVNAPPRDPQDFADFMAAMANRYAGRVAAWEIWNEPDEPVFWDGGPEPARYAQLLAAAYRAVKAQDPAARVVFGPTTGNNYGFVERALQAGAGGSFDAVAVHTDTACLTAGPSRFYRENGRVGRFTFLGYREVRASLLAHGIDVPIWMTELGWSATRSTCRRGASAGRKPAGVTEADQARFLTEAFGCLAETPYVQVALWFTNRDERRSDDEEANYGLRRADGSARPAERAFREVAGRGARRDGACGDFAAPRLQVLAPRRGQAFLGSLRLRARTTSRDAARITFAVRGAANEIRNFTPRRPATVLSGARRTVGLTWRRADALTPGDHVVVVSAVDRNGNERRAEVPVRRVDPATLAPTATRVGRLRLSGRGRVRSARGSVTSAVDGLPGKARVQWQARRRAGWKTIHGGLRNADGPFAFTQRLRFRGRWRVRVVYPRQGPFLASASGWRQFRVR